MSVKIRKHSKRAKIQPRVVNQTRASLQNLPEKKESLSLQEAIYQLRNPLEAAIIKGYSYQELATILEQRGIPVSVSTLKNYLTSAKRIAITKKLEQQAKLKPSNSDNGTTQEPIANDEDEFWLQASQTSLDAIWDNTEDDIYAQLLQA